MYVNFTVTVPETCSTGDFNTCSEKMKEGWKERKKKGRKKAGRQTMGIFKVTHIWEILG